MSKLTADEVFQNAMDAVADPRTMARKVKIIWVNEIIEVNPHELSVAGIHGYLALGIDKLMNTVH